MLQELKQIYSYSSWIVYKKYLSAIFLAASVLVKKLFIVYVSFTYRVQTVVQSMWGQAGGQRSEVRGQKRGNIYFNSVNTEEELIHVSFTSSDAQNIRFTNAAFCRSVAF